MENSKKFHEVCSARTDDAFLYLTVDGQPYRIAWSKCGEQFMNASSVERALIQVSPAGYGLHWPLLDEDLAIDPLLEEAEQLAMATAPKSSEIVQT